MSTESRIVSNPFLAAEWISLDRRVRVLFGGEVIADTMAPRLLTQHGFLPVYAFPEADVRLDLLEPSEHTTFSPYKGDARYASVVAGGRRAESAAWTYPEPRPGSPDTSGYWGFDFHSMDTWLEEDEELRVHARDPYLRVDAIPSSRHVQVLIADVVVADTERPVLLFETGLVTRYYVPRLDVRNDLLVSSETYSLCPYKGRARYCSAVIDGALHEDVAWYYPAPLLDVHEVTGHLAFWGERPDTTIIVDGVAVPPLPERSSGDGGELLKPARRFFRLPPPASMAGARPGELQHDYARPNGRAEGPPDDVIEMAVERAGGRPGVAYPGPSTFAAGAPAVAASGLTSAAAFTFGATTEAREYEAVPRTGSETVVLEPSPRRVRALVDGVVVADSAEMKLLHEAGRMPVYAFPRSAIDPDRLVAEGATGSFPASGEFRRYGIRVGERVIAGAAYRYLADADGVPGLSDCVFLDWRSLDAWFEEEEQIFKHPRDPYHRVDVQHSSREVVVHLDGVEVARSNRPRLLFETDLPTRYYLPALDVRTDLLRPSDKHTVCPYKGTASYYSLDTGTALHEDIVWTYPMPLVECPKLQDLLCFFNEHVEITVDGVLQDCPQTSWS